MKPKLPLREIIFGLEDGIVSTLGVIVGIAAGTNSRYVVILSGLVIIFVESLSMAAGTYLSNKSDLEQQHRQAHLSLWRRLAHRHDQEMPVTDSIYMWLAYMLGGTISLLAFFFLPPLIAIIPAVSLSFISLFLIGYLKGRWVMVNPLRSGLEMMLVSAAAATLGYIIGSLASYFLNIPV